MNQFMKKDILPSNRNFGIVFTIVFLIISFWPLLNNGNLEDSINKIYSERKKIYNESDFRIKCNSMNIDQIVDQIIKIYENTENQS